MSVIVVGISGKIGSGKDYVGRVMYDMFRKKGFNPIILAFGDYLKKTVYTNNDIEFETLFDRKTAYTRKLLQTTGMEMRKKNDDIFVDALDFEIILQRKREVNVFIITDVRFDVEYSYITNKKNCVTGTLRVNAPDRTLHRMNIEANNDPKIVEEISSHVSETQLDNEEFDCVLDNSFENEGKNESIVQEFVNYLIDISEE